MRNPFSAVTRMELEQSNNTLNAQVLGAIQDIETMAKVLRSDKKDPRVHLSPQIEQLKSRIYQGYLQASKDAQMIIDDSKVKYEADQIKNASKSLYKLEMAKLSINAMTTKEAEQRAIDYTTDGNTDLNYEEAQVLLSRVTDTNIRDVFKESISSNMLDKPWLNTPELLQVANDKTLYESLGSDIMIEGRRANIENVLDLEGAMEVEK